MEWTIAKTKLPQIIYRGRKKKVARRQTRTHCCHSTCCQACHNTHSTCDHHRYDSHREDQDRHQNCMKCHLCHCSLNALRAVLYSASKCPNISHQVSSFLKFTYTTLSKTVIVDNLDAWILDSEVGNRNRPHIFLLPFLFYKIKGPCAKYNTRPIFFGFQGLSFKGPKI
jgi:hypothetical protein